MGKSDAIAAELVVSLTISYPKTKLHSCMPVLMVEGHSSSKKMI